MLKTLKINNFTVFGEADLQFSSGLNVIVGENGTGKSHLLKLGYAVLRSLHDLPKEPAKDVYARDLASSLVRVFLPDSLGRLTRRASQGRKRCEIEVLTGKTGHLKVSFSNQNTELVNLDEFVFSKLPAKALFIPPKEVLSIFQGFQYALENRELPFDDTYLDIVKKLNGTPLQGPRLDAIKKHLNPLEELMGGEMHLVGTKFYFYPKKGAKLEAPLMAEGYRKLGMLSYLLKIGSLKDSTSLFWDEPEANLNPKLLKALAEMLVELSKVMQITIATHSLFLLRELEILQEEKKLKNARYFGLHLTDDGVTVQQGDSSNDIGDIVALEESLLQSDRYLDATYQD